jgi:hypothetical protein
MRSFGIKGVVKTSGQVHLFDYLIGLRCLHCEMSIRIVNKFRRRGLVVGQPNSDWCKGSG